MKKTIKLLAIILAVMMLMPFTVVNATSTKVEEVLENLNSSNLFQFLKVTAKYENDTIEIVYPSTENKISFSIEDNVIKYESGDITNYDEAKAVVDHFEYFKEFIMNTTLKLNGYTQEQINDFFELGNNNLSYELNGIEMLEIGGDKTFISDNNEGDITTPAMSMKIDLERANLKTSSSDEKDISGTTVDEVIEALKSNNIFSKYNRITAEDGFIEIIRTDTVLFPCKDGILTYESGDVTNYYEANDVINHHIWADILVRYALEANGYSEKQVSEFLAFEGENTLNYELNGIEILEIGGDKTFSTDEYKITTPAMSIKIDFERANIEKEIEVLEGANQTYKIGEDSNLTFIFDVDYDMFKNYGDVWLDETRIEEDNYTSKSGSTVITFNDEFTNTLSEGEHHLEIALAQGRLGIAKTDFSIEKVENKTKEYIIYSNTNSGDSISFTALDGETYSFDIRDRKDTTDEELQEAVDLFNSPEFTFEALKEQLNKIIGYGKSAAGDNGTLLKLYEMYLYNNGDEIREAQGGFKLKLKMTDDMNGYDTYKLIYIADDGTTEKAIELVKNGEYLEGTLPHLSLYALVGSKSETTKIETNTETEDTTTITEKNTTTKDTTTDTKTSNNPGTGDNIVIWISLMAVSIIGIAGIIKFSKKNK